MPTTWFRKALGRRKPATDVAAAMKRDWDARARENPKWFINTVKAEQTDAEFDELGRLEVEGMIFADLEFLTRGRDPRSLRVLEIGCGLGRMTRALASRFGEVHATDVSSEMIRRARERLADLPHVTLHETSGLDCRPLPADAFDLVFSVYVFQHIPSVDAIRSNIFDAFRVLRPGGILKFQTMDFASEEFRRLPKDTWAGAAFTEPELRDAARTLGARLLEISGRGTQYCWTTMAKRTRRPATTHLRRAPTLRLLEVGRWDDRSILEIPRSGANARLSIVASDGPAEELDASSVTVVVGGRSVAPDYVGPVHRRWRVAGDREDVEVIATIPAGAPPGPAAVHLEFAGAASAERVVQIQEGQAPLPRISAIQNAADGGLDVEVRGPKSTIFVTIDGLEAPPAIDDVRIHVQGHQLEPIRLNRIEGKVGYLAHAQLPDGLPSGPCSITVSVDGRESAAYQVDLEAARSEITLAELIPTLDDAAAARAQGLFDVASGTSSHPLFSRKHYLERNPDVARAGVDPLLHYIRRGAAERRDPHPLFHTDWYLAQCRGAMPPGMTPLTHYLTVGFRLQLDPHPLFSTSHYLRHHPELTGSGVNPLVHYVTGGWRDGLDPHPLFSNAYFADQLAEPLPSDVSPLEHYLRSDPASAPDPHPLFSARLYLAKNPDVAASGINPLLHFAFCGAREGRSPHRLFDPRLYRERCGDRLPPGANPLVHFLEHGEAWGISPHELLDGTVFPVAGMCSDSSTAPARLLGPLAGVGTGGAFRDGWVESINSIRPLPVPSDDPRPPAVSVFVRVGEPVETLAALMSLRWHRSRHRQEILLWTDETCQLTDRILSRLEGVRIVVAEAGASRLPQAKSLARGQWVVFHDGCSRVGRGWLEGLLAPLERGACVGFVGGEPRSSAGAGSNLGGIFAVPRALLAQLADGGPELYDGDQAAEVARRIQALGLGAIR